MGRSLWAAFFFGLMVLGKQVVAASFHVPDASPDPISVAVGSVGSVRSCVSIETGVKASGSNNIGSLWDVTDYGRPPQAFGESSAFAQVTMARWWRLRIDDWWVGGGSGWLDNYTGNSDAGQLWIDLHSDFTSKLSYTPVVHLRKMSVEWMGFGRSFESRLGASRIRVDFGVRKISSDDFEEMAVVGSVSGDQFEGSATRLYSRSLDGGSRGRGLCLDTAVSVDASEWKVRLQAEGLFGRMRWDNLTLDSGYLTSPRVFIDADGFLRYVGGGFTGVTRKRSLSGVVDPRIRLFVARSGKSAPTLDFSFRRGDKPVVGLGIARRMSGGRVSWVRYYPRTRVWDLGKSFTSFQLRIASDSWFLRQPKHAILEMSVILH
ncbi:MAG: hypothetical protein ACUVRS_09135 [Armatimonadota bacterium]